MRAVFAAVLTALTIAGGAPPAADASPIGELRTAGAHKGAPPTLLARATFDDDEVRPSRRGRVDARHWKRPGYAKHRHARHRYTEKRYVGQRYVGQRYAKQRYAGQRYAKQRHVGQRYAKQRHVGQRYAKHSRHRWTGLTRQSGKGRRVTTGRPSRKAGKVALRSGRIPVRAYPVLKLPIGSDIVGVASYYWEGTRTATGARFNPSGMTAAHRTLPFGTKVRVTHLGSGRSVVVRINDRGPYIAGRIIDLSKGAAGVLGMHRQGVARVKVTVLSQ